MEPPENTPDLAVKITDNEKRLRYHPDVGSFEYYRLLQTFRFDLLSVFDEPDSIIKYILKSLEAQFTMNDGNIPPSYHLFELNVLLFFKVEDLREETVSELFKCIFPRLSCPNENYNFLRFFNKIIRNVILKDKEAEILRKLQSLMSPSDKKCVQPVTSITQYILTNWDREDEQKHNFIKLMQLPKWSKLEFYICEIYFFKFDTNVSLFRVLLERIFQGFQENYTAYAAHILFEKVVSKCHEGYYDIIENDVVSLLNEETEQKTLHSSLIAYVIPTMSDRGRQGFIRRSTSFISIYKLHTVKYCYYKNYISDIDITLLNDILIMNSNDKAIVTLVWELCCSFPSADRCINEQHLSLFMKCVRYHYNTLDYFLQNCIHSFLSQVVVLMIRNNRTVYLDFFIKLENLVCTFLQKVESLEEVPESKGVIDVHTKVIFLMSRSYLALRTKYKIAGALMYSTQQNPLHNIHVKCIMNSWYIIKNLIRNGCENNCMYWLTEPYHMGYDASFVSAVHSSLMVAITKSNLDQLNRIRIYTKILIKIFKDYKKPLDMNNLMLDILKILLLQCEDVQDSYLDLKHFAHPLYASGEALHVIAMEYSEGDLAHVFNASVQVITKGLLLVSIFTDTWSRKFLEQIFITHIQIMKTCTKRLHNEKQYILEFLPVCEQVMCRAKFRKVTTMVYDAAINTIVLCHLKPFYKEIVHYLITKLNIHLEEIEQVALNRCSGNKEMLLLTFKALAYKRNEFIEHFERMLNVSQGHQELHLAALEAVCSDAELKDFTAPYLIQMFKKTISIMSHRNFRSRNAATQLIKVLANRLMGTKSELGQRPLSALQAFERYPELAKICFDILDEGSNDSKYGVLIFIGDAPYNSTIFGESFKVPRNQIANLTNIYGMKMLATRALAMIVKSKHLYHVIYGVIKELQNNIMTPYKLLFMEYLLERLINSGTDEVHIQKAITEFRNLLKATHINESPDAMKYLKYPNYDMYKLNINQVVSLEKIEIVISKCLFLDNFVALSFVCFYIELIFDRLEDSNKQKLFQKLIDIFTRFNRNSSLIIHQYYKSIKNLLVNVPQNAVIDISASVITHIFIAEVVTSILRKRSNLLDEDKDILICLKDNFSILTTQCENSNEQLSDSVISTLINLLYLFPAVGFSKSDFYYLLVVALLHILDKNKFCSIFKIITNKNHPISHYIQCLPKIIKQDLGTDYLVFVKNVAKHVAINSNNFFLKYSCLYDCPEKYINVKIDNFLIKMVLEDMKSIS